MRTSRFLAPLAVCLLTSAAVACGGHEASVPPAGVIPYAPLPSKPKPHPKKLEAKVIGALHTEPAPPIGVTHFTSIVVPDAIKAITGARDRSADDVKIDPGRHPAETLAFTGVAPGLKVADLGTAGGYMAELLARAVGPTGKVYGQNSKWMLERFAEKPWSDRLKKPVMRNVVRVDRDFDDPLPPEAKELDLVVDNLFYHDTVWMKTDRDKMNQHIFDALKHGGAYVIIDHSGRAGTGTTEAQTIHRIEEKVVVDEVQKAGFHLKEDAEFLRNTSDPRDWNTAPRAAAEKRGTSDRFVLKFVKP